jgi:ABC-type nitrate/sulfonate/bicarbonate transport system substrate-binding protein
MKIWSAVLLLFCLACSNLPLVSPETLKVAIPKSMASLIVLTAQNEHYFADAGLRVELIVKDSPTQCFEELAQKKVDLALTDTSTFVFEHKGRVKIISELYSSSQTLYLVVPEAKTKAKDLLNLKGYSIRLHPRSSDEWFVNLLSLAEGLDLNSNSLDYQKESKIPVVTLKKAAFVMDSFELNAFRETPSGATARAFSSRVQLDISFLATLSESLPSLRLKIERFLNALLKAENKLRSNPANADAALAKYFSDLKPETIAKLRSSSLHRLGLSNTLFVLLEEQDKWVRTRYQRKNVDLSVNKAMEPSFLRKIKPGSVTLSEDHLGGDL